MSTTKSLPQCIEAEERLLSCCLIDVGATLKEYIAAGGNARDFVVPANRLIFERLQAMLEAGQTVDLSVLWLELKAHGELDQVSPAYLTQLSAEPTTANAQYLIATVREHAKRRAVIESAQVVIECAADTSKPIPDGLSRHLENLQIGLNRTKNAKFPGLEVEPAEHTILEPSETVVNGLIERGDKVVIGGSSKSHKTWTFIDLALSIAEGSTWWGFQCERGPVLFVNFEIKPKNFWKRVFAVRRARGFEKNSDFQAWQLRGKGFNLDDHARELVERAKEIGAVCIVLDPIYKLYGKRNENAIGDMSTLFDLFDKVAAETGACIVYGAHFAKGSTTGKDAMERISGSGGFQRDPDAILTLTRLDEAEGTNAFEVSITLRDMPPIDKFGVQWSFPLMTRTDGLNLKNLHDPSKKQRKYTIEQVLEPIRGAGLTTTEWQRVCEETLGMSSSTFYNAYAPEAKKRAKNQSGLWTALQ